MRFLPYVLKHLRHSWLRTASTVAAMALCIFLFCVLQTVIAAISASLDTASTRRLVTRNAISLTFGLPVFYLDRIAAVEGVKRVAGACWFGGVYQDPKNFFPSFAVDATTFLDIYPEYQLSPEERRAFLSDLRGCIVGKETAERFGWKLGQTLQLVSYVPGYRKSTPFEFIVRGIYTSDEKLYRDTDLTQFFFHYRYLHESVGRQGGYSIFDVEITDPELAGVVSRAIDAQFENSSAQTKTETEAAFRAGFISLAGNLAFLLHTIGLAVTFTILIVTANTMAMAVRERRKEIAVLKTVGFSGRLVMALVLGESLALGLMGGGVGIALGAWVIHLMPGLPWTSDFLRGVRNFELELSTAGLAAGLAIGLGLLAGLFPALRAYRAPVTTMLRQV